MIARLALLSALSVSLAAQAPSAQTRFLTSVKLEIEPEAFPPQYSFQLELKATMGAIDQRGMAAKGRKVPIQEDMLFEQASPNIHKWNISYVGAKSKIQGSSKNATFKFSKPPKLEIAVPMPTVEFEGKLDVFVNGALIRSMPIKQIEPIGQWGLFAFHLKNSGDGGSPEVDASFAPKLNVRRAPSSTGDKLQGSGGRNR
jgi:hypothetical protein